MNNIKLSSPNISLGSDPEFFLEDPSHYIIPSGEVISEFGLELSSGKIIRDGVQVEINPTPSVFNKFCQSIISNIENLLNVTRSLGESIDAQITDSTVVYPDMETLPEYCLEFGCVPSFSAYGNTPLTGISGRDIPFRSAGGHIHIGAEGEYHDTITDYDDMIQYLDAIVGIPSVIMDPQPENARLRRQYYGLAGEYRKPKYGIEYRTLSNFWIWNKESIITINNLVAIAVAMKHAKIPLNIGAYQVQEIINTSDVEAARAIWQDIKIQFINYIDDTQFDVKSINSI